MKDLRINLDKIKKTKKFKAVKKGIAISLTSTLILTGLTGCETEMSNSLTSNYSKIDSNSDDLLKGITKELEIPGQKFKLVVEYKCVLEEGEEWTITSDKNLFMRICTKGLPKGEHVWIDNIHIDTSIMAAKKEFDGIVQDSMDDRIHNSLMLGFPISDEDSYYGICAIDGQNDTFIQGTIYGYQSVHGDIEEKRFLESDYLKEAVYANKINSVFDLLIQDSDQKDPVASSTSDKLQVDVCNKVKFMDDGKVYYKQYEINEDGSVDVITVETGKTKKKVK